MARYNPMNDVIPHAHISHHYSLFFCSEMMRRAIKFIPKFDALYSYVLLLCARSGLQRQIISLFQAIQEVKRIKGGGKGQHFFGTAALLVWQRYLRNTQYRHTTTSRSRISSDRVYGTVTLVIIFHAVEQKADHFLCC